MPAHSFSAAINVSTWRGGHTRRGTLDAGGAQDGELSSEGGSEKGGDDSDHEEELVREEVGAT